MTYSIVARDPQTGHLGVAVQSHYFSSGGVVPWAQPGVGAVATQAMAQVSYGPLGLQRMGEGASAPEALAKLLAADDERDLRQVAMVDAEGQVAAHTGARCIAEAGHHTGDGWSVQANMMTRDTVWSAMADAFAAATGDLADRMLAALDAAEADGGDIRGRQSAGLLVVGGEAGDSWERIVDVRVDDHTDPLPELRRLVAMRKAYTDGEPHPVMGANPELHFWRGVHLAHEGRAEEARALLDTAYAASGEWRELLRRLVPAGLLPDDPDLMARLTE